MLEHVPIPEGVTLHDFFYLIEYLKGLQPGAPRRVLKVLGRAEERGLWLRFDGAQYGNIIKTIHVLRTVGWPIQGETTVKRDTWRQTRVVDVSGKSLRFRKFDRYEPLDTRIVYRLDPIYMRAMRAFLRNYRENGRAIESGYMKRSLSRPFREMLEILRLSANHTHG